jgi:hypothetical protein
VHTYGGTGMLEKEPKKLYARIHKLTNKMILNLSKKFREDK